MQALVIHGRLDAFRDLRPCSSFGTFPYGTEREVIELSSFPDESSPGGGRAELLTWTQVQMMGGSLAGVGPPCRDMVS